MIDPSIIAEIDAQYPCRLQQLTQLSALIGDADSPSPQAIIIHGLEATGKTLLTRTLLERTQTPYAWIAVNECITARQLTERIGSTVAATTGTEAGGRCDTVSSLATGLEKMLREWRAAAGEGEHHRGKFFVVLDRVDELLEGTATLLPGLRRLGEMIPGLTLIFILSVPHASLFASTQLPHIHFPPYTKDESISILSLTPLPLTAVKTATFPTPSPPGTDDEDEVDAEETLHVYRKFLSTVYDSLARGAARPLPRFRHAVEQNWFEFVQPIARGEYGTRNYAALYVRNKDMFRKEDSVLDSVLAADRREGGEAARKMHDLPLASRWLLCASYLASYNPAKEDARFFMKASELKKKRRGGGGGGVGKRAGKTRKISRRLLGAQGFTIERLMAIFHAITPEEVKPSVDLLAQVATLTSLRLLVKASALDPLDGSAKWKVNVGWDYVRGVARSVKFDIEDRLAE